MIEAMMIPTIIAKIVKNIPREKCQRKKVGEKPQEMLEIEIEAKEEVIEEARSQLQRQDEEEKVEAKEAKAKKDPVRGMMNMIKRVVVKGMVTRRINQTMMAINKQMNMNQDQKNEQHKKHEQHQKQIQFVKNLKEDLKKVVVWAQLVPW